MQEISAFLFDCDGVLADTEKDGHRVAFNQAFEEFGIDAHWDEVLYGDLVKIGGGKNRMAYYFAQHPDTAGLPSSEDELDTLIWNLHKRKSEIFQALADELPARPGVARFISEILDRGIKIAVASSSAVVSVERVLTSVVGPDVAEKIRVFGGEDVHSSKPDPEIYLVAMQALDIDDPASVVVVEDSGIGLTAGVRAGARVLVTPSYYTQEHDFTEATAVVSSLGDDSEKAQMIAGPDITNGAGIVELDSLDAMLEP